jgi:hypothetical protein
MLRRLLKLRRLLMLLAAGQSNTPISPFPTRIKDALFAAGLKTVGQVREMSDEALLSLPDLASVAHLRETVGLPSTRRGETVGQKPS